MQLSSMQGRALPGIAQQRACASRSRAVKTRALFGRRDPAREEEKRAKAAEKEEQYRLQQEVLQRRKQGTWQKEVTDRRKVVSRYLNDKEFKKEVDAEKRKRFKEKKDLEEDPPLSPFSIIIPVNPIGMPEYDGGERWDLRLPYVDEGWVDEDADVMGKIARFFKGEKKAEQQKEGGDAKSGKRK